MDVTEISTDEDIDNDVIIISSDYEEANEPGEKPASQAPTDVDMVKKEPVDEEEEEEFLVINVDKFDDIDGILDKEDGQSQTATEPEEEKEMISLEKKTSRKKNQKSSKTSRKRKKHDIVPSLADQLMLSDSSPSDDDVDEGRKEKGIDEENNNGIEIEGKGLDSEPMKYAIYSFGNSCPRMLRGLPCIKEDCSWIHYMTPEAASTQFYRIIANRPIDEALQFYQYFTDIDVQEKLIFDAREHLGEGGEIDVDAREVCRHVLTSVINVSETMDLTLDQLMKIVDLSSCVFDVNHGLDVLVKIFRLTLDMIKDSGGPDVQISSKRLVKWGWKVLYTPSVQEGIVLPNQFYPDFVEMLFQFKMIEELVEVLFYTSLMPSLKAPLRSVADVLVCSEEQLLKKHSTAVLTSGVLACLTSQDWSLVHSLEDIKPGIQLLMDYLVEDESAYVKKFFETLPELDGLMIPEVAPTSASNTTLLVQSWLQKGEWSMLTKQFCKIKPSEVERLAEFTEAVLLEISQLCGQFRLLEPISVIYKIGTSIVKEVKSVIHKQFWFQLGASLLICEVVSAQWASASSIVKIMSTELDVDWLMIKPPGIHQFADIDQGMICLFVLETLVRNNQNQEIVKYLNEWDCLSCLRSELARTKRDMILLPVAECLLSIYENITVDYDSLDIIIRINEVMNGSMELEDDPNTRQRHAELSNKTLILMLNANLDGSRLYKRYVEVKKCHHEMTKDVIRGLVTLLAHHRNNMIKEAMSLYSTGVRWHLYSPQPLRRPLTLKLTSVLSMEELNIIVNSFLGKLQNSPVGEDSLNIYFKLEELSVPNCKVRHLNSIGCSKKDLMFRLDKVLVSPLKLRNVDAMPFIEDSLVRKYLENSNTLV